MAFLLLGLGYLMATDGTADAGLLRAGGAFAILAAFLAWYNALAGIADSSNSCEYSPAALLRRSLHVRKLTVASSLCRSYYPLPVV